MLITALGRLTSSSPAGASGASGASMLQPGCWRRNPVAVGAVVLGVAVPNLMRYARSTDGAVHSSLSPDSSTDLSSSFWIPSLASLFLFPVPATCISRDAALTAKLGVDTGGASPPRPLSMLHSSPQDLDAHRMKSSIPATTDGRRADIGQLRQTVARRADDRFKYLVEATFRSRHAKFPALLRPFSDRATMIWQAHRVDLGTSRSELPSAASVFTDSTGSECRVWMAARSRQSLPRAASLTVPYRPTRLEDVRVWGRGAM